MVLTLISGAVVAIIVIAVILARAQARRAMMTEVGYHGRTYFVSPNGRVYSGSGDPVPKSGVAGAVIAAASRETHPRQIHWKEAFPDRRPPAELILSFGSDDRDRDDDSDGGNGD